MEWGFACVRSRAFRLGPEAFAFVPFLDMANHAVSVCARARVCVLSCDSWHAARFTCT